MMYGENRNSKQQRHRYGGSGNAGNNPADGGDKQDIRRTGSGGYYPWNSNDPTYYNFNVDSYNAGSSNMQFDGSGGMYNRYTGINPASIPTMQQPSSSAVSPTAMSSLDMNTFYRTSLNDLRKLPPQMQQQYMNNNKLGVFPSMYPPGLVDPSVFNNAGTTATSNPNAPSNTGNTLTSTTVSDSVNANINSLGPVLTAAQLLATPPDMVRGTSGSSTNSSNSAVSVNSSNNSSNTSGVTTVADDMTVVTSAVTNTPPLMSQPAPNMQAYGGLSVNDWWKLWQIYNVNKVNYTSSNGMNPGMTMLPPAFKEQSPTATAAAGVLNSFSNNNGSENSNNNTENSPDTVSQAIDNAPATSAIAEGVIEATKTPASSPQHAQQQATIVPQVSSSPDPAGIQQTKVPSPQHARQQHGAAQSSAHSVPTPATQQSPLQQSQGAPFLSPTEMQALHNLLMSNLPPPWIMNNLQGIPPMPGNFPQFPGTALPGGGVNPTGAGSMNPSLVNNSMMSNSGNPILFPIRSPNSTNRSDSIDFHGVDAIGALLSLRVPNSEQDDQLFSPFPQPQSNQQQSIQQLSLQQQQALLQHHQQLQSQNPGHAYTDAPTFQQWQQQQQILNVPQQQPFVQMAFVDQQSNDHTTTDNGSSVSNTDNCGTTTPDTNPKDNSSEHVQITTNSSNEGENKVDATESACSPLEADSSNFANSIRSPEGPVVGRSSSVDEGLPENKGDSVIKTDGNDNIVTKCTDSQHCYDCSCNNKATPSAAGTLNGIISPRGQSDKIATPKRCDSSTNMNCDQRVVINNSGKKHSFNDDAHIKTEGHMQNALKHASNNSNGSFNHSSSADQQLPAPVVTSLYSAISPFTAAAAAAIQKLSSQDDNDGFGMGLSYSKDDGDIATASHS